ncbi:hypothetical protein ROZALSC1DRAFT_28377, partial [Rozella allomycis CSF55]
MFDNFRFLLLTSTFFGVLLAQGNSNAPAPTLIDKCRVYDKKDGDALLVSESPKTWKCGPRIKDCYLYSNELKCTKCAAGELVKIKSGSMVCGQVIKRCEFYNDNGDRCDSCEPNNINFSTDCLEIRQAAHKKKSYDFGLCDFYERTKDNFAECTRPQYCVKKVSNNRCLCVDGFVGIGTEIPECIKLEECNAKDNSVTVPVPDAGKQCFRNDEDGMIATLTLDGKELSILKEDSEVKSEIQLVVASDKTVPIKFKVNADKSISFKDDKYNRFIQV